MKGRKETKKEEDDDVDEDARAAAVHR